MRNVLRKLILCQYPKMLTVTQCKFCLLVQEITGCSAFLGSSSHMIHNHIANEWFDTDTEQLLCTRLLLICGGWVSLLTGAAAGADRLDC